MNPATKLTELPNLTADILADPQIPVDNLLVAEDRRQYRSPYEALRNTGNAGYMGCCSLLPCFVPQYTTQKYIKNRGMGGRDRERM